MNQPALYDLVMMHLAQNESLVRLISLHIASQHDDLPFPKDKLLGDWEFAIPGQKVKVTWTDPYNEEEGYLFVLPGCEPTDILNGAFVHIPNSFDEEGEQKWFVLKHLAVFAAQIELLPNL